MFQRRLRDLESHMRHYSFTTFPMRGRRISEIASLYPRIVLGTSWYTTAQTYDWTLGDHLYARLLE